MFLNQEEYTIRCEWGQEGVGYLGPISDVIIIIDVCSFSTAIAVATERGALIFPSIVIHEAAYGKALENNALLAGPRTNPGYSLSPSSLLGIKEGTRLVLPSINGSTLSMIAENINTAEDIVDENFFTQKIILAGCIRNARAVAQKALKLGRTIAVIPAGERWPDNTTRFAIEDLCGAGAILDSLVDLTEKPHLKNLLSPEAQIILAAYRSVKNNLYDFLKESVTAKQLTELGFEKDILLATELNVSTAVPQLVEGAYRNVS